MPTQPLPSSDIPISIQVTPDLNKAIEALKAKGVQGKVGIVGFCWGGKMSTLASQVRLVVVDADWQA